MRAKALAFTLLRALRGFVVISAIVPDGMPETPLISVVMPVRNLARYVGESIDSVLSQTCRDFEFIIIDDGSTDGTGELLDSYAKRDPRIRLLRGPCDGISKALNLGLSQARGKYIARMDGDDLCLPARLEKQVTFMEANRDHVLVGCRCTLIDPDGRPICEKTDTKPSHDQINELLLRMKWPIVHPAIMIRADTLAEVGGYNESFRIVQDHDLFLRLGEAGKLANLQEILFLYRQHFKSATLSTDESRMRLLVQIVTDACRRRGIAVPDNVAESPLEYVSEARHRRIWVWLALAAGNKATARHHAMAVLWRTPLSKESWMAALCALRGH
jgi:glycosyltransferase involved in cell wall biosynthesis